MKKVALVSSNPNSEKKRELELAGFEVEVINPKELSDGKEVTHVFIDEFASDEQIKSFIYCMNARDISLDLAILQNLEISKKIQQKFIQLPTINSYKDGQSKRRERRAKNRKK